MTNSNKTILAFHIGRGGRFNNAGHLFFVEECQGIGSTRAFESLYTPECPNEDGDYINDESPESEWKDSNGNSVGLTNAELELGIGKINQDNDYDSTYTTYLETDEGNCNLDINEMQAVFKQNPHYFEKYVMPLLLEPEEYTLVCDNSLESEIAGWLSDNDFSGLRTVEQVEYLIEQKNQD